MPTLSYKGAFCINRLLLVGLLINSASFGAISHATELKKVDQVVATEAAGNPIDRRQALTDQTDEISQWQAGRIHLDGQWLDLEDLQEHKLAPQLAEYRKRRDAQELDAEGHRQLAKWCQSHQLPEMASLHWKAVIATAIEDEEAHKALGHKKVDEKWFTAEELKQADAEQEQQSADLKEWMPQIRKIVSQLQSSDAQTKLQGLRKLESITSESAVDALKLGALQLEPSAALPMVSQLKSIRSKGSCLALCKIALADPTSEVGRTAIEALKTYDEHFYVPELLQMLELPVAYRQELVYMPNGSLAIRQAYTRENMKEVANTDVLKGITTAVELEILNWGRDQHVYKYEGFGRSKEAKDAAIKLATMEMKKDSQTSELWNELQKQQENNAKVILSQVSGIPISEPANAFWQWWPNFNEEATTFNELHKTMLWTIHALFPSWKALLSDLTIALLRARLFKHQRE